MAISHTAVTDMQFINDLQSLRWQHRIVMVFSQDKNYYQTVIEQLQAKQSEVIDRDIIWFVVTDDTIISNKNDLLGSELKNHLQQYDSRNNQAELLAVLIGKDGGVKARQKRWDIKSRFGAIDLMPMRQREMLESKSRKIDSH